MRERLSSRSARFPLIFATLDSDSSKEPNDARREKELLVSGYKAVSRPDCIWLWSFQLQGIKIIDWANLRGIYNGQGLDAQFGTWQSKLDL